MIDWRSVLALLGSHASVGVGGFLAGIYLLPILIAPASPTNIEIRVAEAKSLFKGEFRRDLRGSDFLHWGEGTVSVGREAVALMGRLAPGPDYRLYLSPEFVETEADFVRLRPSMVRVGDVRTFENFVVTVPQGVNPADYTSVVVWCEAFARFITAAKYR